MKLEQPRDPYNLPCKYLCRPSTQSCRRQRRHDIKALHHRSSIVGVCTVCRAVRVLLNRAADFGGFIQALPKKSLLEKFFVCRAIDSLGVALPEDHENSA